MNQKTKNLLHKGTSIFAKASVTCSGKVLNLDDPIVMGIVNLTPDSFYQPASGRLIVDENLEEEGVLEHVGDMIRNGAKIIDIGGVSSRPGAAIPDEEVELTRVLPAIHLIKTHFPDAIISVDTFRAEVARLAVNRGAAMINDISAGNMDKAMFSTIAELNVPYVMMHMKGVPETMQKDPVYDNVVNEILDFFIPKIKQLRNNGVMDIIIDPGFGFGKTMAHNYEILKKLDYFNALNLPVMAGLSRKSLIYKVLGVDPEHALNGTTVLHTIALLKGVNILRVHDVKPAIEAIQLVKQYASII